MSFTLCLANVPSLNTHKHKSDLVVDFTKDWLELFMKIVGGYYVREHTHEW